MNKHHHDSIYATAVQQEAVEPHPSNKPFQTKLESYILRE